MSFNFQEKYQKDTKKYSEIPEDVFCTKSDINRFNYFIDTFYYGFLTLYVVACSYASIKIFNLNRTLPGQYEYASIIHVCDNVFYLHIDLFKVMLLIV